MALSRHWDDATIAAVAGRMGMPPDIRFFTAGEVATASALCDRLLAQDEDPRVPVVAFIDQRLTEKETDGWHYDDMPPDDQAWRDSLAALDEDARRDHGVRFDELAPSAQVEYLQAVQGSSEDAWHGMPPGRVWGLWTRYACTAFYSHPWAWEEIGFTGPAYPRGYKNRGIDAREPFEVRDDRPDLDPTKASRARGAR